MNFSPEPPKDQRLDPVGSDPAFQQVTIPYFLYEAMARAYYSHDKNADVPIQNPSRVGGEINLDGVNFNPMDIPSHWKPGGVAAKERHVSAPIQTAQEED